MNRLWSKQNSTWCSSNSLKPFRSTKNPNEEQEEWSISVDKEELDRIYGAIGSDAGSQKWPLRVQSRAPLTFYLYFNYNNYKESISLDNYYS